MLRFLISSALLVLNIRFAHSAPTSGHALSGNSQFGVSSFKSPKAEGVQTELLYAQTSLFWETIESIRSAKGDLSRINGVLESKYGKVEEAFSRFTAGYSGRPPNFVSTWFGAIGMGSSSEATAVGVAHNPVVPELHARAIYAGLLDLHLSRRFGKSEILGELVFVGGLGREKRIDAVSTDLIEKIPTREGTVSIFGPEFTISKFWKVPPTLQIETELFLRLLEFNSTTPRAESTTATENDLNRSVVRWKWTGTVEDSEIRLGIHFIAGPQPVPTDLLPRFWDYAHEVNSAGELGTLMGMGTSGVRGSVTTPRPP